MSVTRVPPLRGELCGRHLHFHDAGDFVEVRLLPDGDTFSVEISVDGCDDAEKGADMVYDAVVGHDAKSIVSALSAVSLSFAGLGGVPEHLHQYIDFIHEVRSDEARRRCALTPWYALGEALTRS